MKRSDLLLTEGHLGAFGFVTVTKAMPLPLTGLLLPELPGHLASEFRHWPILPGWP